MDPVQDDVIDVSDALVTAQTINEEAVTWCLVRLVRRIIGLNLFMVNSVHAHLHGVRLG